MNVHERVGRLGLGKRLFLAFAAVAALPLLVVPLVIRAVTQSYDLSFARELDDAVRLVETEYERQGADLLGRGERAAVIVGPELASLLDRGDPAQIFDAATTSLARTGLDVLSFTDRTGRVLLSGHLPGRLGDQDPLARELLARGPGQPSLALVDVFENDVIATRLALVVVMPAQSPAGAAVVAGRFFTQESLSRLGQLVQGSVSLGAPGQAEQAERAEARGALARLFGQTSAFREVPVHALWEPQVLLIRLPDDALAATKSRIALGAIGAFLLALGVSVGLAAVLARHTVGPVTALVEGTRELARGDFTHRVDVRATGEIAQLVEAFNSLATELTVAHARVARAERIAAWQQIARALAHEIKNPLTPIAMAIETLQRTKARAHPDFDRFFDEGTATVLEEVARLKRLATEFGEFARWPKPMPTETSAEEILQSVASLYQSPPEGIIIEAHADDDLPQVFVDRDQIQRALVNLVKNAIEAMPEGGRIALRAHRVVEGVSLDVADDGPGLPGATRERLFEPYFTTKTEGTGLGLAIVHRIVTEHDGRLEVGETPGGGTTFRLILPSARTT